MFLIWHKAKDLSDHWPLKLSSDQIENDNLFAINLFIYVFPVWCGVFRWSEKFSLIREKTVWHHTPQSDISSDIFRSVDTQCHTHTLSLVWPALCDIFWKECAWYFWSLCSRPLLASQVDIFAPVYYLTFSVRAKMRCSAASDWKKPLCQGYNNNANQLLGNCCVKKYCIFRLVFKDSLRKSLAVAIEEQQTKKHQQMDVATFTVLQFTTSIPPPSQDLTHILFLLLLAYVSYPYSQVLLCIYSIWLLLLVLLTFVLSLIVFCRLHLCSSVLAQPRPHPQSRLIMRLSVRSHVCRTATVEWLLQTAGVWSRVLDG